jgi:hypothetical protein
MEMASKLQKREKTVLAIGAVAVVAILVYAAVFSSKGPGAEYRKSVEQVAEARRRIEGLRKTHADVQESRKGYEQIEQRIKARGNFDLYGFLTKTLNEAGLKERFTLGDQPTAVASSDLAAVKLSMSGVSIKELTDLLHKIYADKNLVVLNSLEELRPEADEKGLYCRMVFVTPKG